MFDFSVFAGADAWIALLTLMLMEIVLGIDNIVFIAILVGRLPEKDRRKARFIGLGLAMLMRIGLLFSISWVMQLTKPLFHAPWPINNDISGKDLVLLIGGLFLVGKATFEIHHKIEGAADVHLPGDVHDRAGNAPPPAPVAKHGSLAAILTQIVLLDIVFSLDSVITAVGMVKAEGPNSKGIYIMITAVVLAVAVMLVFSGPVSRIIERHPTLKMLALSFLILIGVMLTVEGGGGHINKGYIYSAMAFSLAVELLNIWVRTRAARKRAA